MTRLGFGFVGTLLLVAQPAQAVSLNFQPGGNDLVSFDRVTKQTIPGSSGFVANSKVQIFENFDGNLSRGKAYTLAPTTGGNTAGNRRGIALIGPTTAFTTGPGGGTVVATSTITANVYNTAPGETGTGEGARPFATAATPLLSTGNFASIRGSSGSPGRFAINFLDYFPLKPVQVFSFALGSVDAGNSVTLYFYDNTALTFAGTQLTGGTLTADQADGRTNGRVTFDTRGTRGGIKGVVFQSTNTAFEFDGFAAAVPEPATWGMMILGFGLAGYGLRRGRRPATA
jgi:hypothetical protein